MILTLVVIICALLLLVAFLIGELHQTKRQLRLRHEGQHDDRTEAQDGLRAEWLPGGRG